MGINHQIKRADAQKSAAVRKGVQCSGSHPEGLHNQSEIAGTQALPADTTPKPKGGRPSTGFDKKAYMSAFMRDKRKADKLGLKVSEYRKMKGDE